MNDVVSVLTLGVVTGLQTALLAIGLVLIYRASRFLNFAQGQMGAIAAAVLAVCVFELDLPYAVAFVVALAVGGLTGAGIERLLSWRLFDASRLTLLIATIGVSQLALLAILKGPLEVDATKLAVDGYPEPFSMHWNVGSVVLTSSQVTTLIFAPLIAFGLFVFLSRTRTGRAVRGAASNPDAARLCGVSVRRMSLLVWIVAGLVSALASILYAPSQPSLTFAAAAGISLLLRGLAAALLGGMRDFRIAFVAAIALGIVEQGVLFWTDVVGLADVSVVAVLVIGLLLRGRVLGKDAKVNEALTVEASEPPVPGRVRELFVVRRSGQLGWLALLALVAVAPVLPGLQSQERATFLLFMVSFALVGMGLTVLTGWAGQVSLGQFAFLGVGAFAASYVARYNASFPLMLLVAGLVAAAASVLVGLVAVRLRGLFLGVVTLGFAFVAPGWLFRQRWVTRDPGSIVRIEGAHLFGTRVTTVRAAYAVGVVVLVLTVLALRSVRRSGVGRALVAVRDNDDLAAAYGMTPVAVKLVALAIAGFVTGMGGALWGFAQGTWTFSAFDPTMSFVLLAVVIVGGIGTLHGPILGTIAVFAWPYLVPDANTLSVRSFTSGLLLLVVLLFAPGGLASVLATGRRRAVAFLAARAPEPFEPDPAALPLEVAGVSRSFGGIGAVRDLTLHVRPGEIVGLIGGNGAGKSTLVNCISGHVRADEGRIVVRGRDVSGLGPEYRPFLGVGRTFQDAHLFPGLTVLETVMAAMDRTNRTGALGALVWAPWVRLAEREKRGAAREILRSFGLEDRAESLTSELSTGMRRVCDIAAIAASGATLVLLDEPTAGLAQREVESFAPVLRRLRDERGCSMLVVEHDMPLLMSMCDRIYCLEQGAVIAEGTPAEVRADPRVIASYLGADVAAIERSVAGNGASGGTRDTGTRSKSTRRAATANGGTTKAAAAARGKGRRDQG